MRTFNTISFIAWVLGILGGAMIMWHEGDKTGATACLTFGLMNSIGIFLVCTRKMPEN